MRKPARMSSINLQKERETTFEAARKPSESTSELTAFRVRGTRDLGSFGGINVTNDASVDLGGIIGPQRVSVEVNPTEQSAKVEVDLGIKKGFGIEFGGEVNRTPTGVSVENVSFGVNALGFGVNAEGKGNESSKLGVSAFGFSVEVASDSEGNTSVRLGFALPGFGAGVTFQPDGKKKGNENAANPPSTEIPSDFPNGLSVPSAGAPPIFGEGCLVYETTTVSTLGGWDGFKITGSPYDYETPEPSPFSSDLSIVSSSQTSFPRTGGIRYAVGLQVVYDAKINGITQVNTTSSWHNYTPDGSRVLRFNLVSQTFVKPNNGKWILLSTTRYGIKSTNCKTPTLLIPQDLPNQPQRYKIMDCCELVKEIHKYLGIAKLKKHKMKIAKAFLAPGGKGEEECEDYYAITQALFRMLANGLIINPLSNPLGSEWKSVNATAWAGQVYEMVSEAMSNGDTSQKFEISTIMQQVQIMSAVAELSRKVDFMSEVLGVTPDLATEVLPVCFTIHEAHKGFEKKPLKEIDVAAAKTDDEVEKVLGKMLQPSKIPIVKWVFKPDSISIAAALNRL